MQITWDLVVLVALAVGTLYGAFLGRNKILGILVYLYLGLAVAQASGATVYGWIADAGFASARLATTVFGVKTLIFVLVAALLMFKSEISGLDSAGTLSKFQTGILGFLTAAFALASLFSFMTTVEINALNSNFSILIFHYSAAIITVPILFIVGLAFFNRN